jgi:outer membrane protein OmpA-like peptidoglycan-associated protein
MRFNYVTCFSLVTILGLAACATTDPYTGEEKTSNTAKGAGIGVLAGAVLGAAVGGDREGAAIGAALGAGVGSAVGHQMDRQEAELRSQLEGTGVRVQREGDHIRLIMPGNITFAVDSYDIRSDFYPVLQSVALVINKFNTTVVDVGGHTDSTGGDAHNKQLSERRASSVADFLRLQQVDPARLRISGYGPDYPIADNSTPQGRALNRRVEILLSPA